VPLALVVIAGMVLFAGHWLTPQLLMRLDAWLEIQRDRYATPALPPAKEPVPADLEGLANSYGDEWAREDAMKRFQELYEETGDWDRVRAVVKQLGYSG